MCLLGQLCEWADLPLPLPQFRGKAGSLLVASSQSSGCHWSGAGRDHRRVTWGVSSLPPEQRKRVAGNMGRGLKAGLMES